MIALFINILVPVLTNPKLSGTMPLSVLCITPLIVGENAENRKELVVSDLKYICNLLSVHVHVDFNVTFPNK